MYHVLHSGGHLFLTTVCYGCVRSLEICYGCVRSLEICEILQRLCSSAYGALQICL